MQPDLLLPNAISIQAIVEELNVSIASINNWVASGELEVASSGFITDVSYANFRNNVVGVTRLNKRANKLHVDKVNIETISINVSHQLLDQNAILAEISHNYERSLGKAYRNQEGVYYTPDAVVDVMFARIEGDVSSLTFFDPCCGSGNFLLGALRRGFLADNIYGVDCDGTALKIAKARIEEVTRKDFKNLKCSDFLVETMRKPPEKQLVYDVIMTNPPWGKKYPKKQKIELSKTLNNGTNTGTSALFTLAAILNCTKGGIVGMLLPEACSNIATFKPLRCAILAKKILALEDHGKPFKGLLSGAHSVIFENSPHDEDHEIDCIYQKTAHKRLQNSFKGNPNCNLNFHLSQEDTDLIESIYGYEHTTLANGVSWGLGIVTGNNAKYCSKMLIADHESIYKGADISPHTLKKPTNFIPKDLSIYQQVAPETIYRAREKLVYKFISNKLNFYHDKNQCLFLNSANMLILDASFPISMKQLQFLLNSELMNYIFNAIFKTHKILRSDLEKLPIFTGYFRDVINPSEKSLLNYLNIEKKHGAYRIKK